MHRAHLQTPHTPDLTHGQVEDTQAVTAHTRADPQQQIAHHIAPFFARHGLDRHDEQRLVDSRARRLVEMGETVEDVRKVLEKGNGLDSSANKLINFVLSGPFAAAGAALLAWPQIATLGGNVSNPILQNSISAAVFVGFNDIGVGVLKNATADTQWMTAEGKDLEKPMADAAERAAAGPLRGGAEAAVNVQTFTLKNLLLSLGKGAVNTGADRWASEDKAKQIASIAGTTKSAMSAVGSMVAGLFSGLAQMKMDKHQHRVGPEFLLGRKDWESRYRQLKTYNGLDATKSVLARTAMLPIDAAQNFSQSLQSIFTPRGMVADIAALGVGIAANESVRALARQKALDSGASEGAATLAGDLAVAPGEMLYFAAWAFFSKTVPNAADFGDKLINKFRERGALSKGDLADAKALLEANPDHVPGGVIAETTGFGLEAGQQAVRRPARDQGEFMMSGGLPADTPPQARTRATLSEPSMLEEGRLVAESSTRRSAGVEPSVSDTPRDTPRT